MATMTEQDRQECWAEYMRSQLATYAGVMTKAELRAFIDAVDQWISDNAASFNSALPQPARTVLTNSDKARGLMLVAGKRYNVGA